MRYYKIIADNTFVGVVHSGAFLQENPTSHKLRVSTENEGQFVEYEGKLYRDYWMRPIDTQRQYTICTIEEITVEEYDTIIAAMHNNEEIIIEDDDEEPTIEVLEPETEDPDVVLEFVRFSKLAEISKICRQTIENGFNLELRGETYHFSLTTQDQLNLMNLSVMAQTQELLPYHADGEESTFYTSNEINEIINAAAVYKNYQIAYHNALKAYINSLETIEDIAAITYGTPIPDEYKSEVLRVLE